MNFEFFDRTTPVATLGGKQDPFISVEPKGVISFSRAFVDKNELAESTPVTFARADDQWFIAFAAVKGREAFTVRFKDQRRTNMLLNHKTTSAALLDTFSNSVPLRSIRLQMDSEALQAHDCSWYPLKPIPALHRAAPAKKPTVQEPPVIKLATDSEQPPLPEFEITPGSERVISNVYIANLARLKGRHAYLTDQKSLTKEEGKELGQIERRLRRDFEYELEVARLGEPVVTKARTFQPFRS